MIELPRRTALYNGASFKITLPFTWAKNIHLEPGDLLDVSWNEKTGELIIKRVTS